MSEKRAIFTLPSSNKYFIQMNITIQIPDTAYKQLIKGNSRIQGSIGLISPTEGNFNVHQRNRNHSHRDYYKLPHGRVSVGNNDVRFNLTINLDEHGIIASDAIIYESHDASTFVSERLEDKTDFPSPSSVFRFNKEEKL